MDNNSPHITAVNCLECHHQFAYSPTIDACPACGGTWLDAEYDYQAVAQIWKHGLEGRVNSLWRYSELLRWWIIRIYRWAKAAPR
jgi:threonine synthase